MAKAARKFPSKFRVASIEGAGADVPVDLLIDGEWRPAAGGATLSVESPSTGTEIARVAAAGPADVDAAVAAARAQVEGGEWSRLPGAERARLLLALADLIERDMALLARLEAIDVGKPVTEPRMLDIPMAIATLRYFAGWADKVEGRTIPTAGFRGRPTHSYTIREPSGVVAQIIPWNAPCMIMGNKLAPALAAGCAVVMKVAEDAPLAPLHIARLTMEAGFPPGVVNVLPGLGEVAGAALTRHADVDKISFTGSVEVGRLVQLAAAEHFTKVSLELGGKSPHIVLADADLDAAIPAIAMGLFVNQGEVCAAGTRVLVHRSLYEQVVGGLAQAARGVKLGDPLAPDTMMGPLINAAQMQRVLGYIDAGRSEGAEIVAGGRRRERPGYYVEPTVFTGATNSMRIAREEIFGPVGTVIPFDDPEHALAMANDSSYGLTASVWTRDLASAHRLARGVQAGVVWVNAWGAIDPALPWGGVKNSGIGRELGRTALDEYTEEKVITVVL